MKKSEQNASYCASSLTKKELNELRKEFPKLPKKRKTLKEYIHSLKEYDYVVAELLCTRNKLAKARAENDEYKDRVKIAEEFNEKKMKEIFKLHKQISDYEDLYNLKCNDERKIIAKLKETENKRRINSGKAGGLVKQNNILKERNEMYKQVIEAKERDLKKAATIIDSLNKKIKSLKNKPTIEESKQYEMTRKSPRKKEKYNEGGKKNV